MRDWRSGGLASLISTDPNETAERFDAGKFADLMMAIWTGTLEIQDVDVQEDMDNRFVEEAGTSTNPLDLTEMLYN